MNPGRIVKKPKKLWQGFGRQRPIIRSFYSGIGKTAVILPSAFLVAIALGQVTFGMIFFLRDFYNASPVQIGLFSAGWSLSYFLGCLFIRPLFNWMLPRYSIILATSLAGATVLGILLQPTLPVAFVLFGLFGASLSFFWPPIMGWLSYRKEDAELNRVMTRFNIGWSTAMAVSPLLAGFLTELDPRISIGIGVIIFVATAILVLLASLTLPRIRNDRHRETTAKAESGEDRSTPLRFPAWVGAMTSFITLGVIINIFPLFAREVLLIREGHIGILQFTRALSMVLGFIILGRTSFWHFRGRQMLIIQAVVALATLAALFAHSFSAFLFIFPVFGLAIALVYQNSLFHGVSGSTARAKRMAIHEAALTAGMVGGSGLGGLIYQAVSMQAVFLYCVVMILAGVAVQALLLRRKARSGDPSEEILLRRKA